MEKAMVFGTFDLLHPGHLDFFSQARSFGKNLTVVVARDRNVLKIKGRLPENKEETRLKEVQKALSESGRSSDKAILGSLNDPYEAIRSEKPDLICLGYDQKSFEAGLKDFFPGLKIVRLKAFKPEIYKSSIIKKNEI